MKPRESINSTERLLLAYKDYAGMYDIIPRKDGTEIRDYHSISFASMDQKQFEEVANDIHEFCSILLAHCSQQVMDELIQRMLF
jgi:organic hydroperoxide reductase OsmC/OhrA